MVIKRAREETRYAGWVLGMLTIRPKPKANGKGKGKAPPPRRRQSNSSSDSSDDDDNNDDKAAMLAALEARGRQLFGLSAPAESSAQAAARGESDDEDEGEYHTDDGWGADGAFVTDSEDEIETTPAATIPPAPKVPEVVFAPTGGSASSFSKAEKRAFLQGNSAKMMGLKREDEGQGSRKKRKTDEEEE